MATDLAASRVVPVAPAEAFDRLIGHPLPKVFRRRYLAFPPIRSTSGDEPWGEDGQVRRIQLADGGTMRETMTLVERPHAFGYHIDQVRGMMAPLVTEADGLWRFEPAGDGCEITWQWTLGATTAGRATMPVFARLWRGYARGALEEIERILTRPA